MKPGFQLHVTSWENDGDNYKTQIISGLNEIDTQFLIFMAKPFGRFHDRSKNPYGLTGNAENDIELIKALYIDALNHFPDVSDKYKFDIDDEDIEEILRDLLETLLSSAGEYYDYEFSRVCERIKVYFVPGEIEDVTEKFIPSTKKGK